MSTNSRPHFILSLLVALSAVSAGANAAADSETLTHSPHHKGFLSSLNLGIRYSSVLEKRGVILYRDFQIDPVLGLFFFDDRVEFVGDSLGFRDFVIEDRLRLRTRLVSITDQPLFPKNDEVHRNDPSRPDTYEWSTSAELFLPGYNDKYGSEFDLEFSKDIATHHGHYVDLQAKVKLFSARLPLLNALIEPNLFGSLGVGDLAHNQYFYGSSANAGLSNDAYGLWIAFPEEADRYYPIVQIRHFEVLDRNRDAEFSRGRNEGWLFSFIATNGFLE